MEGNQLKVYKIPLEVKILYREEYLGGGKPFPVSAVDNSSIYYDPSKSPDGCSFCPLYDPVVLEINGIRYTTENKIKLTSYIRSLLEDINNPYIPSEDDKMLEGIFDVI